MEFDEVKGPLLKTFYAMQLIYVILTVADTIIR